MDNVTKDIVVSSRIRLARNLEGYNFPIRLNDENQAKEITDLVYSSLNSDKNFSLYHLKNLDEMSALKYLERQVISKELLDNKDISSFIIKKDDDVVVMINEEDHIREQCIQKGFKLDECFQKLNVVDDKILDNINIAYLNELGFLTACPSNIGTGLRASCQLFLPALTMTGAIKGIIDTFSKLDFAVRGLFGEGSEASGYMYQISNQQTLGKSEEELIESVKSAVIKVCEMENECREILFQTKKDEIKDLTYRAYGILSNSYIMEEKEFIKLLSELRLGHALNLIEFHNLAILDEIEVSCRPYNLMERFGEKLDKDKLSKFRADYLSRALKNQRI